MDRNVGVLVGARCSDLRQQWKLADEISARFHDGFRQVGHDVVVELAAGDEIEGNTQRRQVVVRDRRRAAQRTLGQIVAFVGLRHVGDRAGQTRAITYSGEGESAQAATSICSRSEPLRNPGPEACPLFYTGCAATVRARFRNRVLEPTARIRRLHARFDVGPRLAGSVGAAQV
jgi:hypothetical protein